MREDADPISPTPRKGDRKRMKATSLHEKQHQEVKGLFRKIDKSEDASTRQELMSQIIQKLTVHSTIEEDIFYPAVRGPKPGVCGKQDNQRPIDDEMREPNAARARIRDREKVDQSWDSRRQAADDSSGVLDVLPGAPEEALTASGAPGPGWPPLTRGRVITPSATYYGSRSAPVSFAVRKSNRSSHGERRGRCARLPTPWRWCRCS